MTLRCEHTTEWHSPWSLFNGTWDQLDWDARIRLNDTLRGLFCHVPLKRDQLDWDARIRLNDTLRGLFCRLNDTLRGLFCHVPLKRDQWDWDVSIRLNDTLRGLFVCARVYACVRVGQLDWDVSMRLNDTANAKGRIFHSVSFHPVYWGFPFAKKGSCCVFHSLPSFYSVYWGFSFAKKGSCCVISFSCVVSFSCVILFSVISFSILSSHILFENSSATGWRRCIGSQVMFRKRTLSLVTLLRKETCNLRRPIGLRHPVTLDLLQVRERILFYNKGSSSVISYSKLSSLFFEFCC